MNSKQIIERLGGTANAARTFNVSMQAVSKWKITGIPKLRLKLLEFTHPEIFTEFEDKEG